jgi:hypothetical protein
MSMEKIIREHEYKYEHRNGQGSSVRRLWTRLLGGTDGTGQLGQDSVDRTVRAGQPGRIAGTDHLSQDNRRMTTLRVQAAQDRRDRTSGTEQLEQDSKNRLEVGQSV